MGGDKVLRGRVQVPTGGRVREHERSRFSSERTGEIPVPTVTVWMREESVHNLPLQAAIM